MLNTNDVKTKEMMEKLRNDQLGTSDIEADPISAFLLMSTLSSDSSNKLDPGKVSEIFTDGSKTADILAGSCMEILEVFKDGDDAVYPYFAKRFGKEMPATIFVMMALKMLMATFAADMAKMMKGDFPGVPGKPGTTPNFDKTNLN